MNCPICQHPDLTPGVAKCPNCSSDLESFDHLNGLDQHVKKQKQTILIMGAALVILFLIMAFMHLRPGRSATPDNSGQLMMIKNENTLLKDSLSKLNKQLQEKAAPAATAPETKPAANIHKVMKGESLWLIAKKETGDGNNYSRIAKDNDLKNPARLSIGAELKINK